MVTWGNCGKRIILKCYRNLSHWNLRVNLGGGSRLGGTKNWFSHKNWYLIGFIGAISKHVCKIFTKNADLANGCGISNKSRHCWNRLTRVMFLAKIHCQKVVTTVNFRSNLFQRLLNPRFFSKVENFQSWALGY
jgi:hypothetical protein